MKQVGQSETMYNLESQYSSLSIYQVFILIFYYVYEEIEYKFITYWDYEGFI